MLPLRRCWCDCRSQAFQHGRCRGDLLLLLTGAALASMMTIMATVTHHILITTIAASTERSIQF
jgi:hypothetical protein